MIRLLSIIALLAVMPTAAAADPVSSAIAGFIINTFGVGVAGFGTAFAAANFITRALGSVLLNLASQMLRKKPKINPRGLQTEQTTTGDVTPQKFPVGRIGLEGHLVAPAYSHGPNNRYLTYIFEVSNIPITGLTGRVAVDGQWTDIDDDPGSAHADYGMPLTGLQNNGSDRAWLRFHDGTQTTADAMLVDKYGDHPDRPWTTDHILAGTAYAVLTFQLDQEVFSGFPGVRFEVDGIRLYDPRKDTTVGGSGAHRWDDPATWEFTRNPQVINYNIYRGITLPTGDIYGGQVPAEDLPLDAWFAAMNECDVLIGDRVQYQAGFEIDVSVEPLEIVREMNRASFTQISEFGGVFRPRTGAPATPVMSLTDADILISEPSDLEPFPALNETHNAITGTYVSPEDVYAPRSADAIYNSAWEADDGGRRLTMDMSLPAVTNNSQAQHLLNSYVNDARRFRVHTMTLPASFAVLEPLDTIEWTSTHNGYADKVFEVVAVEDRLDTMLQRVTVRERDAGDVAWSSDDDLPLPPTVTGPALAEAPDLVVTAAPVALPDAEGNPRRPAIRFTWPTGAVSAGDFGMAFEVREKVSGDEAFTGTIEDPTIGKTVVQPLLPATVYQWRWRPVSPARSETWTAWVDITTGDVRLSQADMADAFNAKFDTAFERTDGALENIDGSLAEMRDRVLGHLGSLGDLGSPLDPPRLPLDERIRHDLPVQAERGEAIDKLAELVVGLEARLSETNSKITGAGIYVEPESGRVRIQADGLRGEAQSIIDGVNAQIINRVTFAEMDQAITEAAFDPSQLADLDNIFLRLSSAEQTIDAQGGSITSLTETLTVDGGLVTMTTVTQELNSINGALTNKVDVSTFEDAEERLTTAEQELSGFDGARFQTTLRDVNRLSDTQDDAIYQSLLEYIRGLQDTAAVRQSVSFARQDMWARAESTDEAVAGLRVDLAVATENTAALIEQEASIRASADAVNGQLIESLSGQVNDPATGLPATRGQVQDIINLDLDPGSALLGRLETTEAAVRDGAGTLYEGSVLEGVVVDLDPNESGSLAARTAVVETDINDPQAGFGIKARIGTIETTKVDASGAVSAVNTEISAKYGDLVALATATEFAESTVDGIKSGFVWSLGGGDVLSLVQVGDGISEPTTTARLKSDYIRLDGDVEVTGDFKVGGTNLFAETITAENIEARGITQTGSAGSGVVTNNSSAWTDIASFVLGLPTTIGSDITGMVSFRISAGMDPTDFPSNVEFRVTVEGNVVALLPRSAIVDQGPFMIRRFTFLNYSGNGQGGQVRFQMRNAGGYGVNQSSLTATAFYR